MNHPLKLASLILTAFVAIGCENKGPAEQAGEAIDNTADDIADAGKDIGNAVEDACEEIKEGSGAKDTDC